MEHLSETDPFGHQMNALPSALTSVDGDDQPLGYECAMPFLQSYILTQSCPMAQAHSPS